MNIRIRSSLLALCAAAALASAAPAQSTAFTYQGELRNAGVAATGAHDLRFRLYDATAAGTQLGPTVCLDNVVVTDGRFVATIDFGQHFATPAPRFLEIIVRADIGQPCTDDPGYVTLTPRQQLSATPLANHAKSAFSLDAPDGSPANAVFVDNNGRVGIGTTAPSHNMHIAAPIPTLALHDSDSTTQQVGYISFRDSANAERAWVGYGTIGDPDFSIVNARPSGDIVLLPITGNVGIGTSTPTAKLEVHGDIRLGSSGQLRATASGENLRIVRGTVSPSGSIVQGGGFAVVRLGDGDYAITFTSGFGGVPTVTATVDDETNELFSFHYYVAGVFAPTTNSVRIRVRGHSSSSFPTGRIDQTFHFIAIGPQ